MSKSTKIPSPNDQRANIQNPNNPAHRAAQDNRANQLNPQHPAHSSSRGGAVGTPGGAKADIGGKKGAS